MSRAGKVWDNSAMASFFRNLKTERTARKVYRSREHAKSDVFDYIEWLYNPMRVDIPRSGTSAPYSSRRLKSLGRYPRSRQQPTVNDAAGLARTI